MTAGHHLKALVATADYPQHIPCSIDRDNAIAGTGQRQQVAADIIKLGSALTDPDVAAGHAVGNQHFPDDFPDRGTGVINHVVEPLSHGHIFGDVLAVVDVFHQIQIGRYYARRVGQLEAQRQQVAGNVEQPGIERLQARADLTGRCKSASEAEKNAAIDGLAEIADVELPDDAPPPYAPMSWGDLRACETRGMTFGAHTVTHPILAQASDAQSAEEIIGSVERLRAEAARPVSIFCYPNGRPQDFGEREFATLRSVGIVGALGQEGHASRNAFRAPDGAYRVPRVGFPRAVPNLSKQLIRSLVSLGSPEQGPTDRYQSGTGPEQPAHPEPTGE